METVTHFSLVLWSTPLYTLLILFEIIISNMHHEPTYTITNTFENIYLSLLNAGLDILMRGASLIMLQFFFEISIFQIECPIFYWIILTISLDFLFYILHLIDHKCRIFWAIHVTHHSSNEFNLTVGFRSSVFQPLYRFLYFTPLALIGFNPIDILFVYAASQIYGILLHTKWISKLGPLEWILATPSHHRVHHGSNPEYIDKNMGMLLIIWDRMFGTFQEELSPVQYGITKRIENRLPHTLVFHEWIDLKNDLKQAKALPAAMKILFGPPVNTTPIEQSSLQELQSNATQYYLKNSVSEET